MLFGKPLSREQIAAMARILGPAIDRCVARERATEEPTERAVSQRPSCGVLWIDEFRRYVDELRSIYPPQEWVASTQTTPPSAPTATPLSRLRELRLQATMSQADLAERAGVARTTIVRLETGSPKPIHPSTIRKLAEALNVKPADLRGKR